MFLSVKTTIPLMHVRLQQSALLPNFSLSCLISDRNMFPVQGLLHIEPYTVYSSINTLWIKCDPGDNIYITDGLVVFITRCLSLLQS